MLLYEVVMTKTEEIFINKYTAEQLASLDGIQRFRLFEYPDGACIKVVTANDIVNPTSLTNIYVRTEEEIPGACEALIDRNIKELQARISKLSKLNLATQQNCKPI